MAELFYYTDPNLIQYLINDSSGTFFLEEDGFGLDGLEVIGERTPYQHGVAEKGMYLPPRELLLSIGVLAASASAFQTLDDGLLRNLSPFKDEDSLGTLRRVTHDGRTRDIDCWLAGYSKGSKDKDGPLYAARLLRFYAPDPFFYDPTEYSESLVLPAAGGISFPLSFPVSILQTDIDGRVYPNNAGDVRTWPKVRITGPADDPTIENETTGKTVAITQTQDANDYIEIDMAEGTVVFWDNSGGTLTSILENISAASEFWALERGVNTIHITADNAATGTVTLSWYNRYASV